MIKISAVVLVKNSEKTLERTLTSLREFEEVIVYDNGSSDRSMQIAQSYANVKLIQGEFLGFGRSKNEAAKHAKHDWILSIDSDEIIDSELLETLKTKELDERCVYKLSFKTFYKNILVKHSGWNRQKIKRLYNKKITAYNLNDVHEEVITEGLRTEILKGNVEHYSYENISQFIQKADRYSSLFAQNNVGKRYSSPLKAFFNAGYSFFRTFVVKRGFLDGYVGLIIAISHAVTNFYKYIKLYELNLEKSNAPTHHKTR